MRPQLRLTRGSSWNRSVTQLWQLRTREDNQPSPNICSNTWLPTSTSPPKKQPRCAAFKLISKSALQTWVLPKIWGFAVSKFHSKNNQPVDEQSLRDLQLVTKTQFLQSNSRKISQHTNRVFGNSITGWQPKKKTHEHPWTQIKWTMSTHEFTWAPLNLKTDAADKYIL